MENVSKSVDFAAGWSIRYYLYFVFLSILFYSTITYVHLKKSAKLVLISVEQITVIHSSSIKERFHGGANAMQGQFPSVVSIQTPVAPLTHCNGVVLNENHILTSCQCVFNATNNLLNPFWLRIIAGDLNIMIPSYRRVWNDVTRIYPHPAFNPQTLANDIAVLRVKATY